MANQAIDYQRQAAMGKAGDVSIDRATRYACWVVALPLSLVVAGLAYDLAFAARPLSDDRLSGQLLDLPYQFRTRPSFAYFARREGLAFWTLLQLLAFPLLVLVGANARRRVSIPRFAAVVAGALLMVSTVTPAIATVVEEGRRGLAYTGSAPALAAFGAWLMTCVFAAQPKQLATTRRWLAILLFLLVGLLPLVQWLGSAMPALTRWTARTPITWHHQGAMLWMFATGDAPGRAGWFWRLNDQTWGPRIRVEAVLILTAALAMFWTDVPGRLRRVLIGSGCVAFAMPSALAVAAIVTSSDRRAPTVMQRLLDQSGSAVWLVGLVMVIAFAGCVCAHATARRPEIDPSVEDRR